MNKKIDQLRQITTAPFSEFPWKSPHWPTTVLRTPKRSKLGINYDTAWSRTYPIRLIRALFLDGITRPLIKTLIPPTIYGEDRIQGAPAPVIFAANHSSHLDTPLLASHIPAKYRHKTVIGAGADYFFDRTWKAALWSGLVAAIPIERTRVNRKSGELASSLLDEGWSLIIFPEGGRTPDGFGQVFKGGIAQLAKKANTPVIPVFINGTYEALGKNSTTFKPGATAINFGYPLYLVEDEDPREFTHRIQRAVNELADELVTDWWTARKNAHKGTTPELTGPEDKGWRANWARTKAQSVTKASPNRWPHNR